MPVMPAPEHAHRTFALRVRSGEKWKSGAVCIGACHHVKMVCKGTCLTKIDRGLHPAALGMEVLRSHGCICLKGPAIDSIVNAADSFLQTFCINDCLPSEDKPTPSNATAHSAGVDTVRL